MEILVFFFVSLFAGILAAYLVEQNRQKQTDTYQFGGRENSKSTFDRLHRISRQVKSA